MLAGINRPALAGINRPALAGQMTIKATHGTGLWNMAIFLAHARKMTEPYGINLEFVNAPTSGDIAASSPTRPRH